MSTIDKTMVLKTNGSLMKAESIAECALVEHSAILLTCIKQQLVLKTNFWSSFCVAAKDMFYCIQAIIWNPQTSNTTNRIMSINIK